MLHFRLGPFPVRVDSSFLIAAVLLGGLGMRNIADIAAWIVIVFVSVLVHELGHAMVGRSLGGSPEIVLQGMGGVTFPRLRAQPTWAQQIWLSVAGPLAGLIPGAVGAAVLLVRHPALASEGSRIWFWIVRYASSPAVAPLDRLLATAAQMSVIWTVLNLVPVLPLDGGHVLEIALTAVRKKPSGVLASWISVAVATVLAGLIFASRSGWWTAGIFFLLMAFGSFQRARALQGNAPIAGRVPPPDPEARAQVAAALGQARAALSSGDQDAALRIAEALEAAPDAVRQAGAARIRAGISLLRGEYLEAGRQAGRAFSLAPDPDAAVVSARAALRAGNTEVARTWLKRALEAGAPPQAIRDDGELGALVS